MSKDFDPKNWFFPKDHIGQRSHAGHRAAYSLKDDPNVQWLRKMRFGATAKNRGGKLEVKAANLEVADGYLAYGNVLSGGIHAFSALFAPGIYKDRGLFQLRTGFTSDSPIPLYYYGNGFGMTMVLNNGRPLDPDFNSKRGYISDITVYITWNGAKFEQRYVFKNGSPYFGPRVDYYFTSHYLGSRIGKNITCSSYHGIDLGTDQQYKFFLLHDDGKGGYPRRIDIPTNAFQLPYRMDVDRLSPYNLVAVQRYFRPAYQQLGQDHPIDGSPAKCPGFEFLYSTDNAQSWTKASNPFGSWFQEFNDTFLALDVDTRDEFGVIEEGHTNVRNSNIFDDGVASMTLAIAPISPTRAVVYGVVPYLEVLEGPAHAPTDWKFKGKLKMGQLDLNGSISNQVTLHDENLGLAQQYGGDLLTVKGGVIARYHDSNTDVHYIFTTNGTGGTIGPAVGAQGWATGNTNGFGVGKLNIVFYDSQNNYVLYESTDRGFNWRRQGIVTKTGRVPPGGDIALYNYLIDFNTVVHLRENGVPAGAYQTAPWITDTSFAPP